MSSGQLGIANPCHQEFVVSVFSCLREQSQDTVLIESRMSER